jgi:hypothetical protein
MTYLFKPYTALPKSTDKNFINVNYGGYAHCIKRDSKGFTLPNCVAMAHGMWLKTITDAKGLEIAKNYESHMCRNNAEIYWTYTQDGFKRGQTPKLNALMVWEGKGSLAGHVMVVIDINNKGDVAAVGSNYSGSKFYTKTYYKSGNYNFSSQYTFKGFIYCPLEFVYKTGSPVVRNSKVDQVEVIADSLNVRPTASTSGYSEGYCVPGIYNVLDSFDDGIYKWYRIGDQMWVANNKDNTWCKFLHKTEPKYNITMQKLTAAQKTAMEAWAKAEGVTVTITEA